MALSLTVGSGAWAAPTHFAGSTPSQRHVTGRLPHASASAHYNPPKITCRRVASALSHRQRALGWLSRPPKPDSSSMHGRRGPVSMVFGSGGQQQQRSQQGPTTAPAWHPLEDLGPRSKDDLGMHEGKLSPAEGARTLVETKEEGVLFNHVFPEGFPDGFGLDVSYVTDERGDLYFEVDGFEWEEQDIQCLEQEEVTVVVGYTDDDEDEMMEDDEDELGGFLLSDSDSDGSDDDDDSNRDFMGMMDDYLWMLRGRGVPVDEISPESFGTLGAYGGLDTLETVHPLDFAVRMVDAVEEHVNPEVDVPQAKVTLRGVVELVSPEEERRVRKEWLRRGVLAQEEEVRHVATSLLHDVSGRKDGESARSKEDAARLAQERTDAALEQLSRDLERTETSEEGAGGSAQAKEVLQLERELERAEDQPQVTSSMPAGEGADVAEASVSEPGASGMGPSRHKIGALLRRRLRDLNGFPRPGRSRGDEKQGLEAEESDEPRADSSSEDAFGEESEDDVEPLPAAIPEGVRVESGKETLDGDSVDGVCLEGRVDSQTESVLPDSSKYVPNDRGPGGGATLGTDPGRRPADEKETVTEREATAAAAVGAAERARVAENGQNGKDERKEVHQRTGELEGETAVDSARLDRGAEASTSGSDADGSAAPLDMGGFGRWLTSLEQPETPIIWDQNTGRLWLGRDVQMSGNGLGNGVHGLGGLLWGDAENDDDVESLWRESDGESGEEEEEERPREGPPLWRLRVTSVSFKSPTGAEWEVDVSDYASSQPDVLCGASATLMEQVNHAGHKVARALVKLCERKLGIEVDDAAMVAVDRFGFDLRVSQGIEMKTLRVSFPETAFDEDHAMLLLEDMMWLNKKPDKKVFHYRRPPMDDLGKVNGLVK